MTNSEPTVANTEAPRQFGLTQIPALNALFEYLEKQPYGEVKDLVKHWDKDTLVVIQEPLIAAIEAYDRKDVEFFRNWIAEVEANTATTEEASTKKTRTPK